MDVEELRAATSYMQQIGEALTTYEPYSESNFVVVAKN